MRGIRGALVHVLLIVLCVVSLYPLWFMLSVGVMTSRQYALDPTGIPLHPTVGNVVSVLTKWPLLTWSRNSIVATVVSSVVATVIAALASFWIVYGRGRRRSLLLHTNVALMGVPAVALLVPMYAFMVQVHLINQLPSAIIFYCGVLLPFSVFFLVNFFREIPYEIIEAARVDGASPHRILVNVIAPMSGASTATLLVVNAIWVWNELLIALVFLENESARTFMAGLGLYEGRYLTNQPLLMAAAFLAVLPLGVLYVFGQRFFVRGLTAGIGK